MNMALEREIATFEARLPELLEHNRNQFALVCGDEVTVWDSPELAMRHAAEAYGLGPYLVRKITDEAAEQPSAPALALGILVGAVSH